MYPKKIWIGSILKFRSIHLGDLWRSVGLKLFLLIFCCILGLVAALGYFSYQKSKSIIGAKMSGSTAQTIEQAADKTELLMQNFGYTVGQLVNDVSFMKLAKQYCQLSDLSPEKIPLGLSLGDRLNIATDINLGITGAVLLPIDGSKPVSSSSETIKPYNQEEWFKHIVEADGKLVWIETDTTKLNAAEKSPVISVGRVLRGDGGKDFVILFEIRVSVIESALSRIQFGDTGSIVIFTKDNRLVLAPNPKNIGQSFDIALEPELLEAAAAEGVTKTVKGSSGEQMIALRKLESSGWYLAAVAPVSELVKETKAIAQMTLLATLISAVIAGLLGAFVFRMVGRPLTLLRNMMVEGEKGNLTERAFFPGKDEIAGLGESFNRMMEQLTDLIKQTNDSAGKVFGISDQLLAVSKQTAATAREIAGSTEEIAAGSSMLAAQAEQGSGLTQKLADKVGLVAHVSGEMEKTISAIRQGSGKGTGNMEKLKLQTNKTEHMVSSMMEKADSLKESTASITRILELLNRLVQQTNILSFNATIEAVRAGEAGRGFKVIAGEIRKLSEQSKHSIQEVEQFIGTIRLGIDETVSSLKGVYPEFREQMQSVNETEMIFKQVQLQMDEFIENLTGVNASMRELEEMQRKLIDTMGNVSAVSEESSATSEQVASWTHEQLQASEGLLVLAEQLNHMSVLLKTLLNRFRV